MKQAPKIRVNAVNDAPIRESGRYVLYWMIAQRRAHSNFALEHAAAEAKRLEKPLLVLEALRVGYRWASDRIHSFVIDGMADNAKAFESAGVPYYPYLEPEKGAGSGLLESLAKRSCLVVTDEFPCFFLPRMVQAAGERLDVRLAQVDGNGILPLRAGGKAHTMAHAFRRTLQKTVRDHLHDFPAAQPLRGWKQTNASSHAGSTLASLKLPKATTQRWSPADPSILRSEGNARAEFLAQLPIDHSVVPSEIRGGSEAGRELVDQFFERKLELYADERNQPQKDVGSGLSPYLHFGHISAHDVVRRVFLSEEWDEDRIATKVTGSRDGWWGLSGPSEAFLDEIITWREVGYGFTFYRPDDYHRFDSLPDWAIQTLEEHQSDPRDHVYTLDQFERAKTHDDLWNAAQIQLVREGKIHNYLRMLWGKKILHWTANARDALEVMEELNNKYALDGRNPNSYSGIFWTLGRFDRAWGPEREIFGKVRYMTSENTARKVRVKDYVKHYLEPDLFGS